MKLGRNAPCHCGSGRKYKKCHLEADREAAAALREALPALQETAARGQRVAQRLRDEYGVHINYVSPVAWQGRRVWAIGSRVYPDRPLDETFHEFIVHVLRSTLGEEWRASQAELPPARQHVVLKCSGEWDRWRAEQAARQPREEGAPYSGQPNGWVQYLISLAWDVATLLHSGGLPDALVARLRDPRAFQGARYEVAVAAIFARLNCEIRWLDEEAELRSERHVEFVATHRPTGQQIAVEVKSRHRAGVLNEEGEPSDEPLRGDPRAVRRLFLAATEKAPEDMAFMVFIDVNAPPEPEADATAKEWQREIWKWMGRLPEPTAESPDPFNAFYVTNFAPHYLADDLATGGEWLGVRPRHVRVPLDEGFTAALEQALANYHRVPALAEDGELLP